MRELEPEELPLVIGAGVTTCDITDDIKEGISAQAIRDFTVNVYEGLVQGTSYVIGRVAGDLHPSYYE